MVDRPPDPDPALVLELALTPDLALVLELALAPGLALVPAWGGGVAGYVARLPGADPTPEKSHENGGWKVRGS